MRGGQLFRNRFGGSLVFSMAAITTLLLSTGLALDATNLYATRQKDQVIADSAVLGGAQHLPYKKQAREAAQRILDQYRSAYRPAFRAEIAFYPKDADVPTQMRVDVVEQVPMIFPRLMGGAIPR